MAYCYQSVPSDHKLLDLGYHVYLLEYIHWCVCLPAQGTFHGMLFYPSHLIFGRPWDHSSSLRNLCCEKSLKEMKPSEPMAATPSPEALLHWLQADSTDLPLCSFS